MRNIEGARRALAAYATPPSLPTAQYNYEGGTQDNVLDLTIDLMHLCDAEGIDWGTVLSNACQTYEDETDDARADYVDLSDTSPAVDEHGVPR